METKTTISPATAMHYAELTGIFPPRYEKGKRYYEFECEGEPYTIDVLKNDAPADMNKKWAEENNDGAVQKFNTGTIVYYIAQVTPTGVTVKEFTGLAQAEGKYKIFTHYPTDEEIELLMGEA